MPVQTLKPQGYVRFPDGTQVLISVGGGAYRDIGVLGSAVSLSLNYTENRVDSANASLLRKQIKDMVVDGSFTLWDLDPQNYEELSGGMISREVTAGSAVTAFEDQVITTFVAGTAIPLAPIVTATLSPFKFNAAPALTSVTANTSGVLAANNDYTIVRDTKSSSGYSIVFNTSGTATVATTETITIVFGSNTPAASTTLYAGTSSKVLTGFKLKFVHTNSASVVDYELELFQVNPTSGGIQFNFKGANEDGVDETAVSFQGSIDTSLDDGKQLFRYFTLAA